MEFSFFTTSVPKYKNLGSDETFSSTMYLDKLGNNSSTLRFLYFGTEEAHKKVETALPYSHFVDRNDKLQSCMNKGKMRKGRDKEKRIYRDKGMYKI